MEGVEVNRYKFLISELDGGKWLASCSSRFIPEKRYPSTQRMGDLRCRALE